MAVSRVDKLKNMNYNTKQNFYIQSVTALSESCYTFFIKEVFVIHKLLSKVSKVKARVKGPALGLPQFLEITRECGMDKAVYRIIDKAATVLGASNTVKADLAAEKERLAASANAWQRRADTIAAQILKLESAKSDARSEVVEVAAQLGEMERIEQMIG